MLSVTAMAGTGAETATSARQAEQARVLDMKTSKNDRHDAMIFQGCVSSESFACERCSSDRLNQYPEGSHLEVHGQL